MKCVGFVEFRNRVALVALVAPVALVAFVAFVELIKRRYRHHINSTKFLPTDAQTKLGPCPFSSFSVHFAETIRASGRILSLIGHVSYHVFFSIEISDVQRRHTRQFISCAYA